jgi:hypothetical protein
MLGRVRSVAPLAMTLALVAMSATAAGPARAAGDAPAASASPTVQASSLAERLFQDGRQLATVGDHEGACAKFEASWKIDPRAVGTLLNIAQCKEATGQLATAWGLYREVAQRSRGTRPDRVELAERKERELAERFSSIALDVTDHPRELAVTVDGLALDVGAWSSALPVDPGDHVVEASAPGYTKVSVRVTVRAEKQRVPVTVPRLVRAAAVTVTPPAPAAQAPSRGTRTVGIVLAGAGVLTMGVGGYLGIDVLARADQPKDLCPAPCVRTSSAGQESQSRYDALDRQALASNILLPVGGVLALAGAYLWLIAGSGSAPKMTGSARLVFGTGVAALTGEF